MGEITHNGSANFADQLSRHLANHPSRTRRIIESSEGPYVKFDGARYLSFCSNDYLGLAEHPEITESACRGARQHGVGAGASHLITGHYLAHQQLEKRLANFVGLPEALMFSTGYMANIGVITTLAKRDSAVFCDKLNHASLYDAVILSRSKMYRYAHLDLAVLENQLQNCEAKHKLIITDSVFSMDGDIAPLPALLALCEKYDALLLVDDAHGFGILGPQGRGSLSHFNISSPRIIYMGTLGKAAGVFGAFVAGEQDLIQLLIQAARSYIYTTAAPPLLANALQTSIDIIERADESRRRLMSLIAQFQAELKLRRWKLLDSPTPIQPLVIGANEKTLAVSLALQERGILVHAVRPPTVPKGQARLRITFSAYHSEEDVQHLIAVLHQLEQEG